VIAWASACRKRGMGIIASKSKTVHIAEGIQRRLNIQWEGERMEKVAKMECLVAIISANGKIDTEINNRVQKANQVYCQIKQ